MCPNEFYSLCRNSCRAGTRADSDGPLSTPALQLVHAVPTAGGTGADAPPQFASHTPRAFPSLSSLVSRPAALHSLSALAGAAGLLRSPAFVAPPSHDRVGDEIPSGRPRVDTSPPVTLMPLPRGTVVEVTTPHSAGKSLTEVLSAVAARPGPANQAVAPTAAAVGVGASVTGLANDDSGGDGRTKSRRSGRRFRWDFGDSSRKRKLLVKSGMPPCSGVWRGARVLLLLLAFALPRSHRRTNASPPPICCNPRTLRVSRVWGCDCLPPLCSSST